MQKKLFLFNFYNKMIFVIELIMVIRKNIGINLNA